MPKKLPKKLQVPHALKRGDRLGILACSTAISASSEETIQRAYSYLRSKGFEPVEADNCRKTYGHAAGTIQERVRSLHRFFKDPKIAGILNFWGGYQSHQLLEYLDWDLIRRNPKPFIGFSDTTSLQVAMLKKVGLVTYSAPAGITFGKPLVPSFTWDHFERVLIHPAPDLELGSSDECSDNPWYLEPERKMIFRPNPGWRSYRKGEAMGRLVGGNAGTMLLLAGTEYWPDLRGRILFVEDDESETPQTMDRFFTQLRQMGVYDQISGLIVGRASEAVGFKEPDSLEMILDDALRGYRFPVITGVDFGHTDPLLTLPLGIRCRIDSRKKMSIRLLEPGTTTNRI